MPPSDNRKTRPEQDHDEGDLHIAFVLDGRGHTVASRS
jgi:hypothetical protein